VTEKRQSRLAATGNLLAWCTKRLALGLVHGIVILLVAVFAIVMLAVFLIADLIGTPFALIGRRTSRRPAIPDRKREASIIIVSIDGKTLLERLLPSLDIAIKQDGGDHEIIVVDNGSQDGTVAWLEAEWPQVKICALPTNHFFGGGNRKGLELATKDFLIFLNNDMVVEPNFITPLFDGFTAPDVFAVSSEIYFTDESKRREETGKTSGSWAQGRLQLRHEMPTQADVRRGTVPAFWAGGGSAMFDRRLFEWVGKFESLYDPFYWEDTGASFQAWKRGYRVMFTPRSRVAHEHRTTGKRLFGERYIDATTRRNYYLFVWRNLSGLRCTLGHFLHFVSEFRRSARHKDYRFEVAALARAITKLPQALWLREASRRHYRRSEAEVFRLSSNVAEFDAHFGTRPTGRGDLPGDGTAAPEGPEGVAEKSGDRLRILMLLARFPKRNTDGSWILHNLIRHLGTRHSITLVSFLDDESEREYVGELEPYCETIEAIVRRQTPDARNLFGVVPERLTRDYSDPAMLERIDAYIREGDFDILQCEYVEMAHMLPDLSRIPSVFTHHEVMSLACKRARTQASTIGAKFRLLRESLQYLGYEFELCRRFRAVVTLSQFDQDYLQSYAPDLPVRTIPSGIDLEELGDWKEAREHEGPTVVFVGYFKHPPNIDAGLFLAKDVFPLVRREVPDARCLLVGRAPTDELRALESEDSGVVVTGFVEDLAPYVNEAAVFAVPIRNGAGLRGKLLEGWARGKAVVATSVAVQGFAATAGEHYVEADDAASFAAGIVEMIRDREARRRMGDNGRELVERTYSGDAMATAYERMYSELLRSSP